MTQLKDIAQDNNIELDECIVFIKGDDEILAVDISNVGIKQRSDDTMGVNFTITPKKTKQLISFFNEFGTGEKFDYNISQTGYRPVYYRGLSPVTKEVNNQEVRFKISLMMQKAIVEADDNYFEPTCECCVFHHI